VGLIGVALGAGLTGWEFWRDEGPASLQPPLLAGDVFGWLPPWAWGLLTLALLLVLVFEGAYKENERLQRLISNDLQTRTPPNRDELVVAITDLEYAAVDYLFADQTMRQVKEKLASSDRTADSYLGGTDKGRELIEEVERKLDAYQVAERQLSRQRRIAGSDFAADLQIHELEVFQQVSRCVRPKNGTTAVPVATYDDARRQIKMATQRVLDKLDTGRLYVPVADAALRTRLR